VLVVTIVFMVVYRRRKLKYGKFVLIVRRGNHKMVETMAHALWGYTEHVQSSVHFLSITEHTVHKK